jgi:hypothetical protein
MKKIISILSILFWSGLYAQHNYFTFASNPLNTITSDGDGLVLTPQNELFYKSVYGYMCAANGSNYSNVNIVWSSVPAKNITEIVYGDNKVFYVDAANRLRMLYWSSTEGWLNYELNPGAPAASGTGLVFADNSTLYYTGANYPYQVYKINYVNGPTWNWEYTGVTAKSNSRLAYGDGKLFYISTTSRLKNVYKSGSTWLNSELNLSTLPARGDGLVFGANSNLYYTTSGGHICNVFYNGGWNFNTLYNSMIPKVGSKLLCDQNTLYYVNLEGYLCTLVYDNCDWFGKRVVETNSPKAEAIAFGANQVFYRNSGNNVVHSAKTKVSPTQTTVYLKGKTFYKNNQPFYPVVMNYPVNLMSSNTSIPDLWVGPDHRIFTNNICPATDQPSANVLLASDFAKIKALGFNTLRICGLEAVYRHPGPQNTKICVMKAPADFLFDANYDANTKPKLFAAVSSILTLAKNAGLNVILLSGQQYIYKETYNGDPDQAHGSAYQNYATFLSELSNHCQSAESLLAYDLCNEPSNTWQVTYDKTTNCSRTKIWYDAIRAADPNHLVTMGTYGRNDVQVWDPTMMSVDFHSFHLYSWDNIFNPTDYKGGIAAQEKWIQNNVKLPWIVGETSYSAIDNGIDDLYPCGNNTALGWGTEENQRDFAQFTQQQTRGFGGSGYSWWSYKDVVHDGSSPSEAFEGVYTLCDRKKPVADEFNENTHNWISQPCNNSATPSDKDYYGYDPLISYPVTIIGKVVDGHSGVVPIKDAYVFFHDVNGKWHSTLSKLDGTFKICSNITVDAIRISSIGRGMAYPNPFVFNTGDVPLYFVGCTMSSNMRMVNSISEPKNKEVSQMDVYPNPASNHIIIDHNFKGEFTVEMYDMLGKVIDTRAYNGSDNTVKIDFTQRITENNFVIIKAYDKNSSVHKKIIISK